MQFNLNRVRKLNQKESQAGPVIYWMSREQRVQDNWGLIFCEKLAKQKHTNLIVIFVLQKEFLSASKLHFNFMLEGLKEVQQELIDLNIPFYLLEGLPETEIPKFIQKHSAADLVSDFSPLKIKQQWNEKINKKISIPFYEVDSRNIVPAWITSQKLEYAAYTIRAKIHKFLGEFLTEYPVIYKFHLPWSLELPKIDWANLLLNTTHSHESVLTENKPDSVYLKSGTIVANQTFQSFLNSKLEAYGQNRNDPNLDGQSNLSPYLHFGQISSQRVALEVFKILGFKDNIDPDIKHNLIIKTLTSGDSKAAFLEELIVRRELSDNFCLYNPNYDSFYGFHEWAKKSLNEHRTDRREFMYVLEEFEKSQTHDELWNAAQKEMVVTGKMHGFMRMYWAKKILEWTDSPEAALKIAIYLNDKYSLDGRDPNGYAGICWSIGGVHDRAWNERAVFGKVRYMNYKGCKRKFDITGYIRKVNKQQLF